jgi:hypothetical protein
MYEKNRSKIKTKEWKGGSKDEDGCVQGPEHSCFLNNKSQHSLTKRLPLHSFTEKLRFLKPGMAKTILLFPMTQYLYC